jgi:hypothetical protein
MNTKTIEELNNVKEIIENFMDKMNKECKAITEAISDVGIDALISKLEAKPVLIKEYLITAQIEDKVSTNKVSSKTLADFSIQMQFGKVSRNYFRGEEIHDQFSQSSGNKVGIVDKNNIIINLEQYIENIMQDSTLVILTADELFLVDENQIVTPFNNFLGAPTTMKRLKEATLIITQLPSKKDSESLIKDSEIEEIEDGVIDLLSAIKDAESIFSSNELIALKESIDNFKEKQ